MITEKKYKYLKSFKFESLNPKEKKELQAYEKANPVKVNKELNDYFKKIFEEKPEPVFKITYTNLLEAFLIKFTQVERKKFNKDRLEDINTILYYFTKDERFFQSKNLRADLSEPSFFKGLLIVGDFGNGKTITMKILHELFKNSPLSFRSYTANNVVERFEQINTTTEKEQFYKLFNSNTVYFDDVKTERHASNFGKVNVFRALLQERYTNRAKTFITCNYAEEDPENDIKTALAEFNQKYGGQVYDRLFSMFNIIEFSGKSLRK